VPQPAPNDLIIGSSVQGRPIFARRFGTGERAVVLVGGMHGGWEANTVALIDALTVYFAANSGAVPADISLYLIPVANPDGLLYGRTAEGRFNGHGVDLNRNWGCGWQPQAYWRDQQVDAGAVPFSEPETAALAAFLQQIQPSVALFYHSAAGGIFAGGCERTIREADSALMAATYGEAAGYSYGDSFSAYPVTGTAATWADGEGIAAADVELRTWSDPEVEDNLAGVLAVLRWAAENP
jgi:protein MpaA